MPALRVGGNVGPRRQGTGDVMRYVCAMVLGLSVAAASLGPAAAGPTKTQRVQLTADQRAMVEAGVRKELKDPESARFGKMLAKPDTGQMILVCGLVNARNSYGGYAGPGPYIGFLLEKGFVVIGLGNAESSAGQANAIQCAKHGLPLFD